MCECRTIARSPTRRRSGMADREEVERSAEVPLGLPPEREVGGGDGRDEAVVERLGDPKRRVDAVPAGTDGELVQAKLARMVDPEQVHAGEVGGEQLAVLRRRVLTEVPGVPRALGPGRREREAVRRRDVR